MDSKESNPAFEAIQCSESTAVFRFEWESTTYYYKEYRYRNVLKKLKSRNRGKHLMAIASALCDHGFETPKVVCRARKGMRVFVVTEAADAEVSVRQVLVPCQKRLVPDLLKFRRLFGHEVGRLHAAGFVHGDLRWGNVLVRAPASENPVFIYIDNDRTREYKRIPARRRVQNLVQVKFAGKVALENPEVEWSAFWEGYVAGNPEVKRNADYWRRRVDRKAEKRVAKWKQKPRNRHLFQDRINEEGPVR